jgi:hypothetical protein
VYDVGQIDRIHFLTMAFIPGRPLAETVRADQPFPVPAAATLVRKLALALHEAHARGVIHRDLKPANVMIDPHGEPILMDFGLARRANSTDEKLTHDGMVMGTPAYMSPEQVSGDAAAMGPGCDIYSLGVILYELLVGRVPFHGSLGTVMSRILNNPPEPPTHLRAGLDPALEAICLKAMAKRIEDRYVSMSDFAAALAGYLEKQAAVATVPVPGAASAAPPALDAKTTLLPPRETPVRRPRRGLWVSVTGFVAAVVLGAIFFGSRSKNEPHPGAALSPAPPDAPKLLPLEVLFNGKDLTGWVVDPPNAPGWTAEGQAIANSEKGRSWLLSARQFTDFVLTFEFQLSKGCNSGVAVRAIQGEKKGTYVFPLEIQIVDDTDPRYKSEPTGAIWWAPADLVKPDAPAKLKPLGEWNAATVELRGQSLSFSVNGAVVTKQDFDQLLKKGASHPGLKPRAGSIAFQQHTSIVRFRNIQAQDITPPPSLSKPLAVGKHKKGFACEVTDLAYTSDGFLKLNFRYRNEVPRGRQVLLEIGGASYVLKGIYYIESSTRTKGKVARVGNTALVQELDDFTNYVFGGTRPNEIHHFWIKLEPPPPEAKKITLYIKDVEPIEDVPLPPSPKK